MRVLCVGRHALLADHVASVFRALGAETQPAVGLVEAAVVAARTLPDVVLCDYDLLATNPLDPWERDPVLSGIPVVAVSLTRRPEEACAFDVNGIAGFLYLPTLEPEGALRVLRAMARPGMERGDHPAGVEASGYRWPTSPPHSATPTA